MEQQERTCAECHYADHAPLSPIAICEKSGRWVKVNFGQLCQYWKQKQPEPSGAVRTWPD